MGGEEDAARVAGPVLGVEPGVVLRQKRVAGVAENRLDEVEVAHQARGGEETHLHALLGSDAGNLRADDRPEQQGDERPHQLGLRVRLRDGQQVGWRCESLAEQSREDGPRDGLLVAGDRQAALADVEGPLGRAAVAARVVQHAIADPVGGHIFIAVAVAVGRERKLTGDAVPRQREGRRQSQTGAAGQVGEVAVQEPFDPTVGRTPIVPSGGRSRVPEEVMRQAAQFRPACRAGDRGPRNTHRQI